MKKEEEERRITQRARKDRACNDVFFQFFLPTRKWFIERSGRRCQRYFSLALRWSEAISSNPAHRVAQARSPLANCAFTTRSRGEQVAVWALRVHLAFSFSCPSQAIDTIRSNQGYIRRVKLNQTNASCYVHFRPFLEPQQPISSDTSLNLTSKNIAVIQRCGRQFSTENCFTRATLPRHGSLFRLCNPQKLSNPYKTYPARCCVHLRAYMRAHLRFFSCNSAGDAPFRHDDTRGRDEEPTRRFSERTPRLWMHLRAFAKLFNK